MGATPVGILNGYNVSGMGFLGRNQHRVLVGFGLKSPDYMEPCNTTCGIELHIGVHGEIIGTIQEESHPLQ